MAAGHLSENVPQGQKTPKTKKTQLLRFHNTMENTANVLNSDYVDSGILLRLVHN